MLDYSIYEGLIFDCDGTLVDTMPAHFRAWTVTSQKYGFSFPEPRFYALGGVPAPQIVALLAAEAGLTLDPHAVAEEKEQLYFSGLGEVQPIVAVAAIARQMFGQRPLAVATGSPRWAAERVLERTQLLSLFATVVAAGDVERPKPAPDIFLEAARRIGVPPQRCCVFEDGDPGIEGARAAGMAVVDIRLLLQPTPVASA